MVPSNDNEAQKVERKPYQFWSTVQLAKLLEFILINANQFISGPEQRSKLAIQLCKQIYFDKTEQICLSKLKTLLKKANCFGDLVEDLKRNAKVDEKWFVQRTETALSRGIDYQKIKEAIIKKKHEKDSIWTKQEYANLLQFLLLYPEKTHYLSLGGKQLKSLQNHINLTKTQQQCYDKMLYIVKKYESFNEIVKFITKKAQVTEKWVEERSKIKYLIEARKYEEEVNNLKQDQLILEKAQKMLIQNIDFHRLLIEKERNKTNQMFLEKSLISENLNSQRDPKFSSLDQETGQFSEKKQELEERIIKLRQCLFLAKYRRQFEVKTWSYMTVSIFWKMAQFTEVKYEYYWRTYCEKCIKNEQGDIGKVISKNLNTIYLKEGEFEYEMNRIKKFYERNLEEEMVAFTKKSIAIKLTSSEKQIAVIAQNIKKELSKKLQGSSNKLDQGNYAFSQSNQTKPTLDGDVQKLNFYPKACFRFNIKLDIELCSVKQEKKPELETLKLSQNHQRVDAPKASVECLKKVENKRVIPSPIKKQKLSVKKSFKKQFAKSNIFDEELFEEEDVDDHNQSESCIQSQDFSNRDSEDDKKCIQDLVHKYTYSDNQQCKRNFFSKIQKENNSSQTNRKHKSIWSLSERAKITAYIIANQKQFFKGLYFKDSNLMQRLANYIGTKKSSNQCMIYLKRAKYLCENSLSKLFQESSAKYLISKNLMNYFELLQQTYKQQRKQKLNQSTLLLTSYPMFLLSSSSKFIETQIQSSLSKGPFIETMFDQKLQINQQKENNQSQEIKLGKTNIIELEDIIDYKLQISIPLSIQAGGSIQPFLNEQQKNSIKIAMKSALVFIQKAKIK